jgi:asparagine synthase (glutamine-hydrolysing)
VTVSWPGKPAARDWRAHLRRRDWRAGVAALLPEPWSTRVRAARRSARDETPWHAYSAIHPRFAARLRLAELMAADGHDPTFARTRSGLEQRVRVLRASTGELAEAGAAHGVDVRDPTSDLRVVRFCLSTPEAQFLGPRAEGRWLIRRAMTGRLPPEVVWNRRRGLQSADLVLRLRAHADEVEAALECCARDAAAVEYVDLTRLREVWASVRERHDLHTQRMAVAVLCRGLMAGLFVSGGV